MKCVIRHSIHGWLCTDDWGNFFFSESHPAIAYWFEDVAVARTFFETYKEKHLLHIYYPVEERGKLLFPTPP